MVVERGTFEDFARGAAPMLYRTAWLLTHEKHAAEDLVQETLTRVFPLWERAAHSIENPHGYARTTLVRIFLKARKRKNSGEVLLAELPESGLGGFENDHATSLALRTEIQRMGAIDRDILVLRFYADRSVAEVSQDVGLSEAAVRSRSSRAVGLLRARLNPDVTTP